MFSTPFIRFVFLNLFHVHFSFVSYKRNHFLLLPYFMALFFCGGISDLIFVFFLFFEDVFYIVIFAHFRFLSIFLNLL